MSLKNILSERRRIAILRLLLAIPDYTINEDILKESLNSVGITTSDDSLENDLFFLELERCIKIETFAKGFNAIILTAKGEDVARGRLIIDGIKRPSAGENLPDLP